MKSINQIQHLRSDEVYEILNSRPQGLTESEIQERVREVGFNSIEGRQRFVWARILFRQFVNFFSILLDISALLCYVANQIQPGQSMDILGWALFGVSVLNSLFSFVQEFRAEKAMEMLEKFLPPAALVVRDGQEKRITARELVPGDVILVREGDRISADARLIETGDLLVNNAPLTGESRPVSLTTEPSETSMLESQNILFAGCTVMRGSGRAVIFATGMRTEFGKIASLSRDIHRAPSPLEKETTRMVRILTIIASAMGMVFFLYGTFSGRPLWVNVVFMMGIIVANVPEGMLPTLTLSLAMASLRMAKKNVLVKSLNAVEALGSVHVICTDKTGTLTMNRLSISRIADPYGGFIEDDAKKKTMIRDAFIASEIRMQNGIFSGDPLDVCIAQMYEDRTGGAVIFEEKITRHYAFDVQRRRSAGVYQGEGERNFVVKGAFESVRVFVDRLENQEGEIVAATENMLEEADAAVRKLASMGYRIIAVAGRSLEENEMADSPVEKLERNLILRGFLCSEDPLRPEVPDAVRKCRSAGIRVILITGDHPDTARAVAGQAGILESDRETPVYTGRELEQMKENEISEKLREGQAIFARTTPEQKMKIVMALKSLDIVVAMTGDGVNDAPALKAADVGIAMGREGTDVARESAQIILLDDNFASIVSGIEEGRTIYENIKKFISYVLSSNVPEMLPYLLYILFPVPLALTIIQILSIDLGSDMLPAIALGREKPDPEIMSRKPRKKEESLLSASLLIRSYLYLGLMQGVLSLFVFFSFLAFSGWHFGMQLADSDPLYRSATGLTLASVILMQIANVIGRRYLTGSGLDMGLLKNYLMLGGIAVEIAFAASILFYPPMQKVLLTGPVPVVWCLVVVALIPIFFSIDYFVKISRS